MDQRIETPVTSTPDGDIEKEADEQTTPHVDRSDAESIGHQTNILPRRQILKAFPALSLAFFVSFLDQTSVSTAIPGIANNLKTGPDTSWVVGSVVLGATAFSLLNGRLSDIFGRKNCLLSCLALLTIGDIASGFSRSEEVLFACRALVGIGSGGINSIAMIIVSDITTLEDRGKYHGILGAVMALANGIGPVIGGAIVQHAKDEDDASWLGASWRWVFWFIPMITVPTGVLLYFFLPLRYESGGYLQKLKKVDYIGAVLNIAAVILVLIPLSQGGITREWKSPFVIAMTTIGGLIAIAFVVNEWKFVKLPIMPLRLFKAPHCGCLYLQSFLHGMCFTGNFFYLPLYFQNVLQKEPTESGLLMLPLILLTSSASIISAQIMARTGRYFPVVVTGFAFWLASSIMKYRFSINTKVPFIVGTLIVEGVGIGMTMQPTLMAILANQTNQDRGVATALRNFMRMLGGAFGLIITGNILFGIMKHQLALTGVGEDLADDLGNIVANFNTSSMDTEAQELVAYMAGLKCNFLFYLICVSCGWLCSAGIGNTSLRR